jgi:hypothetical protein
MRRRRSRPHLILYAPEGPDDYPALPSEEPLREESRANAVGPWSQQLLAPLETALKPRSRGDVATFLIEGFLRGSGGPGLQLRAGWALVPQISAAFTAVGAGHMQVLSGADGWGALTGLAADIRAMMAPIAASHSTGFWFALLARTEPVLTTTVSQGAKIALPAVYTAVLAAPRRTTLLDFLTAQWRVPPSVMTRLDQLIFLGLVLANIEVAKLRIGKGQQVAIDHYNYFVGQYDPDTEVSRAIALYDARLAATGVGPAASLGAFGKTEGPLEGTWTEYAWSSLLFQPAFTPAQVEQLLKRWNPVFGMVTDLHTIVPAAFLPGSKGLTAEAQALSVALHTFSALVVAKRAARRLQPRSWSRFGYIVRSRREFLRTFRAVVKTHPILADGWVEGDESTAINLLTDLRVVTPIGRRHVIVHGIVATGILHGSFHRPADGAGANVWATAFEHEIQALVDLTPWRPPEHIRARVGKKVVVAGHEVTDIDAIAYRDGVLLLIDCKSYMIGRRLAAGEYWPVKSHQEKVDKAAANWAQRLATIDANRESLHMDLPADVTIAGVVVVAAPPFVLPGPSTESVLDDLLRVTTAAELTQFLSGRWEG